MMAVTVEELIARLKTLNPEATVFVDTQEHGLCGLGDDEYSAVLEIEEGVLLGGWINCDTCRQSHEDCTCCNDCGAAEEDEHDPDCLYYPVCPHCKEPSVEVLKNRGEKSILECTACRRVWKRGEFSADSA